MLICDINALQTINLLNLAKHVILNSFNTLDLKKVMRINATFSKFVSGFYNSAIRNLDPGSVRDQICLGLAVLVICYYNFTFLLGISDLNMSAEFCDNSKALRLTCLKKLLYTRKTLCDILTCNTAGMESSHGKLCTGLTDRLCCYDTYRLAYLYKLA